MEWMKRKQIRKSFEWKENGAKAEFGIIQPQFKLQKERIERQLKN